MEKKNKGGLARLFFKSLLLAMCGIIFPFLYMFFPAMYIIEALKEGILKSIGVLVAVCILIGLLYSPLYAIVIATIFAPLILTLDYFIKTNRPVGMGITASSVIFFVSTIVLFYSFGIDSETLHSGETLNKITGMYMEMAKESRINNFEISSFENTVRIMYDTFLLQLPSILVIISLIMGYVTYTMVGRSLLFEGKLIAQPSSLEFLKMPKEIIFLGTITLLITQLVGQSIEGSEVFSINLQSIILFLVFVQGLGILKFFMQKFSIPRLLQITILAIAIFTGFLKVALVIIGAMDFIVNFREI